MYFNELEHISKVLMRIFFKLKDNQPVEHPTINRETNTTNFPL